MNKLIFFIVIALVFVIIIIISSFFSKKAKIKRKLKKAEFKNIGNFKEGEIAKIVGNVEFVDDPLIAPLSKRKCAYYYIHVEKKVSSGKRSHWKTIIEEELSCKFLIRDGSNYAFINDQKRKCYIVQDKSFSSGFLNDATDHLENFLRSRGYESEGFLGFNKTLRYKEGILESEEEIAVFGKGKWKYAEQLELPKKYRRVLEITSSEGVPIYLSDDPDTTLRNVKKSDFLMANSRRNHKKRYSRKNY